MQKLGEAKGNGVGKSLLGKPLIGRNELVGKPLKPPKCPPGAKKPLLGAKRKAEDAEDTEKSPETSPVVGAGNPEENGLTYFGKISPQNLGENSESVDKILKDSNLFYVGDGVRLPLSIKPLGDGSFGLSISDNICKAVMKRDCPCCVPQSGSVLQELESGPDEPKLRNRRSLKVKRSLVMPVEDFAKKYNLKLNLAEEMAQMNEGNQLMDEATALASTLIPTIEKSDKINDEELNSPMLKRFGIENDDEQYGNYRYQREIKDSWKNRMENVKNFYHWFKEFFESQTTNQL